MTSSQHLLFNFQAVGLAAVVVSVWLLTDQTLLMSLVQEQHNFYDGLYILLCAGVIMLIVTFLGCCGAFRESQCMLVAFFSCLLVVIVAQIAAGAWLYSNSYRLEELVKSSVINTVKVPGYLLQIPVKGISNYHVESSLHGRVPIISLFVSASPDNWSDAYNSSIHPPELDTRSSDRPFSFFSTLDDRCTFILTASFN